jgi:hypothetical protein
VEIAMTGKRAIVVLLGAVALSGCSLFAVDDPYGNSYGGFFDYGNQYRWQLVPCQNEITANAAPAPLRPRYMQCCMWRHGVPIDDAKGCEAPPYSG